MWQYLSETLSIYNIQNIINWKIFEEDRYMNIIGLADIKYINWALVEQIFDVFEAERQVIIPWCKCFIWVKQDIS